MAKPKTCLKIGMSRIMKISVKAMNDSVNVNVVFESKLAIAYSQIDQLSLMFFEKCNAKSISAMSWSKKLV